MWIFPSSLAFSPFCSWMLKFLDFPPFSIKGTSLLPCHGSRHGLLLFSLRTTFKSQLLPSKLCTGFSSWSRAWSVTVPDLQFCPHARAPRSAMQGWAFSEVEELDFIFKSFYINLLARFLYRREKCFLYKCRCLVLCLGAGGEMKHTLFFPSSFNWEFSSYHHHHPPSWDLGPVALKGNILYLCGLKPRNSLTL